MGATPFIIPLFILVGCASTPSPQAEEGWIMPDPYWIVRLPGGSMKAFVMKSPIIFINSLATTLDKP
jgi:hypothetical protein